MTTHASSDHYDVIVVGGGHAGAEAALASARLGAHTLLLTHNIDTLGQMSCNPAIGGIGKSHLVKEIDALGGAMARAADLAGIHFRTLNARKGPAVRATRAQADRQLYKQAMREVLERQPNLAIMQQSVVDMPMEAGRVTGVKTDLGLCFYAPAVVLTAGTFLGGVMHVGLTHRSGGRAGCPPSHALAERFRALKLPVGRLKTGTPPRIHADTVDFSVMQAQPGDTPRPVMSCLSSRDDHPRQVACYITETNPQTHAIIQAHLDESPMFSGKIEGVGPRYCPSIEDKVFRFAERDSHRIFLEPEGLHVKELYPNGISTSLPFHAQRAMIHSIRGMEHAHITRPGYAIEYDYFDPRGLWPSLETRAVKGLFFAGQINGTTGYEEAAAQGIMAGINAARQVAGQEAWVLGRHEAYIGVMIDDLVTHGTIEPYRMFTSRAEHRLLLRENNADVRLTAQAEAMGLISKAQSRVFAHKQAELERIRDFCHNTRLVSGEQVQGFEQAFSVAIGEERSLMTLLRRPELDPSAVLHWLGLDARAEDMDYVGMEIKYEGYIVRQQATIKKQAKHAHWCIPEGFDYDAVSGLSHEVRQKWQHHRPKSVAEAQKIPGITPASVALLLVHLKKHSPTDVTL
jgi:tRNA uridine 5-carboxymethylaminomethyl modification enzyme